MDEEKRSTGKRKKSVNAILRSLEKEELLEVVNELIKLNSKNEKFLKIFLRGWDKENLENILEESKKKLRSVFFSRSDIPRNNLNLRLGTEIFEEYSRILSYHPEYMIDLRLYYVELSVEILDYGYESDAFFNSMMGMFGNFCNDIFYNSNLYPVFKERINEILKGTENTGRGIHDYFCDEIGDLESRLGISDDDQ